MIFSKVYRSSRFWVLVYAFVVMLFMTFQFFIGCLKETVTINLPPFVSRFICGEATLPISTLTWMWTAIVSLYCGFDRVVDVRNTMQLQPGALDFGDLSKLRKIILVSLALLIYGAVGHIITGMDFELNALASSFGSAVLIYVSGNKAVKAFKYSCLDKNNNGVPDEIEDDYEAWARKQRKEGVEEKFITLDYFLDNNPEMKEKIK